MTEPATADLNRRDGMKWLGLIAWLAITFAAAFFGGRYPPGQWYTTINRPSIAPPNWIFGPVWSVLYTCMAIAAWRVWSTRRTPAVYAALAVYLIQLTLNGIWSWLFFGLHRLDWAFAEIAVLLLAILLTIAMFRRHDRLAANLLIPYACWVGFASLLSFRFWQLNS